MNLGPSVLMRQPRENEEAVRAAIGKTISSLRIGPINIRELLFLDGRNNVLEFRFTDGTGLDIYDDGQLCCEDRWMSTDDPLEDFIGATFIQVEVRNGPTVEAEWKDRETAFLVVTTSLGVFTCVNHNEHNGYYGGFKLLAKAIQ